MEKTKILIVDDEERFTELVKLNLESTERFEVRIENDGALALRAAREFEPDLILLDIIMPDVEGGQVAFQIRNEEATKDIPIVFLTAVAVESEVQDHHGQIGGFPFVAKPVSTQKLIDAIERNLT